MSPKLYKLDLIAIQAIPYTTAANATTAAAHTANIANALYNITENLARSISSAASLPLYVGPNLVPRDLDLAVNDDEEE
ncbi:hypothetical protein AK830_g285 [Neonectria ditissima]|uniref:Uncharacterized protein n=1 Tax=Neonectria ditissima TaxID=78410 RepID=A0A0P7BH34_9HYPO|nr:hypothetical protein AK830_g285 [Neonectria ditissima]